MNIYKTTLRLYIWLYLELETIKTSESVNAKSEAYNALRSIL